MDTIHDIIHSVINSFIPHDGNDYRPHLLQRGAMLMMLLLILLSFLAANFQALLWQSSDWLVGAVLPAVVVDLTNTKRSDLELPVLVRNPVLDSAATLKAQDMAKNSYFSHDSPAGVTPWHWFKEAGYSFVFAGENLAIYFSDSAEVVDAWMNSPTHRANIVGSQYREIGVGTAKGTYQGFDTIYVVQMFGAPAIAAPVALVAQNKLPTQAPVAPLAIANASASSTSASDTSSDFIQPQVAGEMTDKEESVGGSEVVASETTAEPAGPAVAVVPASTDNTESSPMAPAEVSPASPPAYNETEVSTSEPTFMESSLVMSDEVSDVVGLYSGMAATSTNLTPAPYMTIDLQIEPISKVAVLATEPNKLLQLVYLVLGGITALTLLLSVVLEWRHHRPLQTAYGLLLLLIMSALFYVHTTIISGAVVL